MKQKIQLCLFQFTQHHLQISNLTQNKLQFIRFQSFLMSFFLCAHKINYELGSFWKFMGKLNVSQWALFSTNIQTLIISIDVVLVIQFSVYSLHFKTCYLCENLPNIEFLRLNPPG